MIEIKIAFKSGLSELPASHLDQSSRLARVTPIVAIVPRCFLHCSLLSSPTYSLTGCPYGALARRITAGGLYVNDLAQHYPLPPLKIIDFMPFRSN